MTAIALQHKTEILDLMAQGKVLAEIAKELNLGVSKSAISQALKTDPDYKAVLADQAQAMIEEAKTETWATGDKLHIARARSMQQFAFRYAESMDSATWAPRSTVLNVSVDLSAAIDAARARAEKVVGEGLLIPSEATKSADKSKG